MKITGILLVAGALAVAGTISMAISGTPVAYAKPAVVYPEISLAYTQDLDAKIGQSFSLDNATFSDALDALKQLSAFKDVNMTAVNPSNDTARRVTMQFGPDTTIKTLLSEIGSLYNRKVIFEGGKARFTEVGEIDTLYSVLTPQASKEPGLYTSPLYSDVTPLAKAYEPLTLRAQEPGQAKRLQELAEQLAKIAQEKASGGDHEKWAKELQEKAAEIAKIAKEMAKSGAFNWSYTVPRMDGLNMKEWMSKLEIDPKTWNLSPDVRMKLFDEKNGWQRFTPEKKKEMEKWLREHGYSSKLPDGQSFSYTIPEILDLEKLGDSGKAFWIGQSDPGALLKSITKDQWEMHTKQGYLKMSQLTAKQRNMLGMKTEGKFSVSYSIDGQTLNIRGD